MANVPHNGDLVKHNGDAYTIRGGEEVGGSTTSSPMESGAPVFTDGASLDANAVNSRGSFSDAKSDPMFDKFKHDKTSWEADALHAQGSESPASVPSSALIEGGAKSDPIDTELPLDQTK